MPSYIFQDSSLKIWGLTAKDRWQRLISPIGGMEMQVARDRDELAEIFGRLTAVPSEMLLVNGQYIIDQVTFKALKSKPGTVLVAKEGMGFVMVAAYLKNCSLETLQNLLLKSDLQPGQYDNMRLCQATDIAGQYHQELRKKYVPYVLNVGVVPKAKIEKIMFNGSYKGVTDIITKYVWPPIALPLTRWAAFLRLTPNSVTFISLLLVLLTTWCFFKGYFTVGLVSAWVMTLLDTVDGKLARVTLTSSKFGNIFDHGIDLIHPPFWWWGWWYGLLQMNSLQFPLFSPALVLIVILAGYVLQRLIEGSFVWRHGMYIHVWQRLDSAFRLITARRNPNLLILTACQVFNQPGWGLTVVALWILFSLFFHLVRLGQAEISKARSGPLVSWLA